MCAGACLVAGCQSPALVHADAATIEAPPRTSGDDQVLELIRYGNWLSGLNPGQLEQEQRELETWGGAGSSSTTDIKLAMLFSVPRTGFQDTDRAIRILQSTATRNDESGAQIASFARLLVSLLHERPTIRADQEMATALVSRERDSNDALRSELAKARAALAHERQQRKTLQAQLDALKRLEQQLSREKPRP